MKKAKKVSIIAKGRGAKARVFNGRKTKTVGGLKKSDLKKNKDGRVVSAKMSIQAKKRFSGSAIAKWAGAVQKARKAIGAKGFVAVGGKSRQGQALLAKARSFFRK